MSALKGLRKVRRATYRAGRVMGDLAAVGEAVEKGTPAPVAKRAGRRLIWKILRKL